MMLFLAGLFVGFWCGFFTLAVVALRYGQDEPRPALAPGERLDRLHRAIHGTERHRTGPRVH